MLARMRERISRWYIPTALAVALFVVLMLHEVTYHLTLDAADEDFPLEVLAEGHRVFVLSHGGLDMLLAAAVAVGLAAAIEIARERTTGGGRDA